MSKTSSFPYSYANVEVLSFLWGVDIDEAKTRFGRQALWRDGRAEIDEALREVASYGLERFGETGLSYDDAALLADAWESSIDDAKALIGKRKLQGREASTAQELEAARKRVPDGCGA